MVLPRFKGLLKNIYFDYGILYSAGFLLVTVFGLLVLFRAITLPLFGAFNSTHLANPAALVATLSVVGGISYQTATEVTQRQKGANMSNQTTVSTAGEAIDLLESKDHLARQHGARVLVTLIEDGAGVVVKRSDRSAEDIIGFLLDTLQIKEKSQSTLHRDVAVALPYFVRDYPEETIEHKAELIATLDHDNPIVQQKVVTSIGNVVTSHPEESDSFIEPIAELVGDDDPQIRAEICYALSRMADERVPDLLQKLANDTHPEVHEAATEALEEHRNSKAERDSATVADSQDTKFVKRPPDLNFNDVAGMKYLKDTLEETIIQPLGKPELFEEYGIGVEQGFLLYGPPGTGKTYITKCLAGELNISYISATAGDLVSKWIGVGAKNVQEMFREARANQPCLIFIDEIDALATDRGLGNQQKSERQMVNQFLEELSASHDANDDVIVIGATNRLGAVDDAMLRTGRLGKTIKVPPPDGTARIGILKQHLDAPTEPLDANRIRQITEGLVSSDIEQIATTAARQAVGRTRSESEKSAVTQEDIEEATASIQVQEH